MKLDPRTRTVCTRQQDLQTNKIGTGTISKFVMLFFRKSFQEAGNWTENRKPLCTKAQENSVC